METCKKIHPKWTHKIWSANEEQQNDPLWKFTILENYGGVLIDPDVECLQPLDEWIDPGGLSETFLIGYKHYRNPAILHPGNVSR